MVDALRGRIMRLMDYFKRFENEDGLLEKLDGWVFVEWSAANQFVQDVNYPTNMLYAAALDAAGQMYGNADFATKAETIRNVIRHQSFDGQFFVDNAVRKDGKLEVTRNRSEVCQYFAFFFGVASPKTHGQLWKRLRDQFGPDRKETKAFPEVHMANSFIGNMLRMELLSRAGRGQQILDESVAYLLYMAERTGTLWENVGPSASCDHGFASHIVHTLYRDILGVYQIDPPAKRTDGELPPGDDTVDRNPIVVCAPAPGSLFPIGDTQVGCTGSDFTGNTSEKVSMQITVQDRSPPVFTATPPDLVRGGLPAGRAEVGKQRPASRPVGGRIGGNERAGVKHY